MHDLLSSSVSKKSGHPLRVVAARQLMDELNQLLWELSPLLCPTIIKFELLEYNLNQYISKNIPSFQIQNDNTDRSPVAYALNKVPKIDEEIANYMKLITSPSLILRALSFLSSLQPEVIEINDDSLSIVFSLMSSETIEKFGEFLHKLATDAASGKFDPYFQNIQSKVKPAIPIVNKT
ncbi:hypothetical protein GPJ56_004241 [Histomonas meleagridis]|uniref:uncharacterized protein n=1 Tax=Histomonas meleagridis TaxID=135588 RepID=UPI00355A2527|nr:hypothetical protein GPJ56_004241 [Histomonas meleagridis]KAH0802210.1 hypothetical protein GO595_004823 [Histomonas meleagridis]